MHVLKSLCLLSVAVFLLVSCTEEKQNPSTLFAELEAMGVEELAIFNIAGEIDEEFTVELDSIRLSIEEDVILDVAMGRRHSYVYVRPGERLRLDTVSSSPLLISTVGEERSPENELLLSFSRLVKELEETQSTFDFADNQPDSFLLLLEEKYAPLAVLTDEIRANEALSPAFKTALQNRFLSIKGNDLVDYPYMHNYIKKSFPELPDDYYSLIDGMQLDDNSFLIFEEGRELANSWPSKDISYNDYEDTGSYFADLLKSATSAYPGTLMGQYCQYKTLEEYINFGNGIDLAGSEIEAFQANVSNRYLQQHLEKTITPWLGLKSGSDAPDFVVRNRADETVRLSDLKGKKVYIDVWATWCGPCIREIPALKTLEQEMHGQDVEFVSVSIDAEKDKEKWLNFIAEKELGGLQLIADGAWKSDVVKAYNIKGIPRFLLVDAAGKIVSADAPRPSDPKVKDVLMR